MSLSGGEGGKPPVVVWARRTGNYMQLPGICSDEGGLGGGESGEVGLHYGVVRPLQIRVTFRAIVPMDATSHQGESSWEQ
jgi:hypothetical protein